MRKSLLALMCLAAAAMTACEYKVDETVTIRVSKVELDRLSMTLEIGGISSLEATVSPSNADNKDVAWSSSDEAVVKVNNSGVVTALAAGSATIAAKTDDGAKIATCLITVNKPAEPDPALATDHFTIPDAVYKDESMPATTGEHAFSGVSVADSRVTVGSSVELAEFYVGVEDVEGHYVIDAAEVPAAASYSARTTRADGEFVYEFAIELSEKFDETQTILISALTKADSKVVALHEQEITPEGNAPTPPPVTVESVAIDSGTDFEVTVGETLQLSATVLPADATDNSLSWVIAPQTVATIDGSGLVTALAAGQAAIAVTTRDGGKTSTAILTVRPVVVVDDYKVSVGVRDEMAGASVEASASTANAGDAVAIRATAGPDQVFVRWHDVLGNATIEDADAAQTTVTMPAGDIELEAEFAAIYALTITAAGEGEAYAATVTGSGKYEKITRLSPDAKVAAGTLITIFAAAAEGNAFTGWRVVSPTSGGATGGSSGDSAGGATSGVIELANASEPRTTFTMSEGAVEIEATFEEATRTYGVAVSVNDDAMGTALADPFENVAQGTTVELLATPTVGYQFVGWTATESTEAGSETVAVAFADDVKAETTFTMPASEVAIVAEFRLGEYKVTASQSNGSSTEAGTSSVVSVAGSADKLVEKTGAAGQFNAAGVLMGEEVVVEATPNAGCVFVEWDASGVTLADPTANPATFAMPGAHVILRPVFKADLHTINVVSKIFDGEGSDGEGSLTDGGGAATVAVKGGAASTSVEAIVNTDLTLAATPTTGYIFSRWTISGMTFNNTDPSGERLTDLSEADAAKNPLTLDFWQKDAAVAGAITATAIFVADDGVRAITVSTAGVTASHAESLTGELVTLRATPPAGQFLRAYTVTGASGAVPVTFISDKIANDATFTMPDEDVEVTAEFATYTLATGDFVRINDVDWATSNLTGGRTFSGKPEAVGKHFQFGSNSAWSTTENISSPEEAWQTTFDTEWSDEDQGPCPTDYRMPLPEEFERLLDRAKVAYIFGEIGGQKGACFVDRILGDAIFLPAAGSRISATNTPNISSGNGFYWTNYFQDGLERPHHLYFYSAATNITTSDGKDARSVRCIYWPEDDTEAETETRSEAGHVTHRPATRR